MSVDYSIMIPTAGTTDQHEAYHRRMQQSGIETDVDNITGVRVWLKWPYEGKDYYIVTVICTVGVMDVGIKSLIKHDGASFTIIPNKTGAIVQWRVTRRTQ